MNVCGFHNPQRSVLGPTIFLLFVDDIQTLKLYGYIFFLYSDDAEDFNARNGSAEHLAHMNDDLATLFGYFKER